MAVRNPALKLLLVAGSILAPILLLLIGWTPLVQHYWVPTPTITDGMILSARETPSDSLLSELSGYYFFPTGATGDTLVAAERLLKGEVTIVGLGPRQVQVPFGAADLDNGPIIWRLFIARLGVARVFVAAYRRSGEERFLTAARDVILAWADYENRALLPKGLLWNDHALAERVQVLSEFWLIYRHSPQYDATVAGKVLRFAARSGEFLADSSQFTAMTNHGAMQNLALLHFNLAFPGLPESSRYGQLALSRLQQQMTFYVSHEGVVLEHSAGYQRFGIKVMGTALRYLTLAKLPIPPEWDTTYAKAKVVYAMLRRPDGTLPLTGDTDADPDLAGPAVADRNDSGGYPALLPRGWKPAASSALYPVAGYAVHWDGFDGWPQSPRLAQTVVGWSNFPSQVHKHADELSVLFWAAGQSWWTNVGYWLDETTSGDAIGWNGSNAPHLKGEAFGSQRRVKLRRYTDSNELTFLDLERSGPGGFMARRQLLLLSGRYWLVLDQVSGADSGVATTVWNTAPGVDMRAGDIPGSYQLSRAAGSSLTAWLAGVPEPSVQLVRGSLSPFGGWQMMEFAESTWAIIKEQPAKSAWSVMAWSSPVAEPGQTIAGAPAMNVWQGPEHWQLTIPLAKGAVRISRTGDSLVISGANSTAVGLQAPVGVDSAVATIHQAYAEVAASHPRYQDELSYRIKVTYVFLALLLGQELALLAWRRVIRRPETWLRLAGIAAWLVVGAYLLIIRTRLI